MAPRNSRRKFLQRGALFVPATFGILHADVFSQGPVMRTITSAAEATAWITSGAGSSLRNNYTGTVGCKFVVAGSSITVKSLGRWCVSGNSGTHLVAIRSGADESTVISANVDLSGATPGQYKYTSVADTTLTASTTYRLVGDETNSGDEWYDAFTITFTAACGTVVSGYYEGSTWTQNVDSSKSYGPYNFTYV